MRFIRLDENNKIISVRTADEIVEGEIPSESGESGQILQEDGSFADPIKTLEETKLDKINEIQQSYYASFTTFQSSATGALKTYPINQEAQGNLKDYEQRLISNPNKDSFWFKTIEDGNLINHTRTQFLDLLEDAELFKVQQTQKYNNLVNQVKACIAKEEVNAIVW